jgi:UDPglucose--hexose-1-phosphate uridylyltransferase
VSTLRRDPTTGSWVIIAPERAARPVSFGPGEREPLPGFNEGCPFCPGNEEQTPPEIFRSPGDGDWRVRVVPNKFAALSGDGRVEERGTELTREIEGSGRSEVIVESRRHSLRFDELPGDSAAEVVRAWRMRYTALAALPGIRGVLVFKNEGPAAGTSLPHPHSQIVGSPVPLPLAARLAACADDYGRKHSRSLYDDLVSEERKAGVRLIDEGDGLLLMAPFASGNQYEMWVMPESAPDSFGEIDDAHAAELAALLGRALAALRGAAGDPDYNLVVISDESGRFRWHVRVIPRPTAEAGFELGSGMRINTKTPEDAAAALRDALP